MVVKWLLNLMKKLLLVEVNMKTSEKNFLIYLISIDCNYWRLTMAKAIPQIYKHEFIEKMETLFPEQYYFNTYYQNPYNMYQYIMRNSRGYFHVKEIINTKYGYTIKHYRIDKNEKIIDTGDRYGYFKTLPDIKKLI